MTHPLNQFTADGLRAQAITSGWRQTYNEALWDWLTESGYTQNNLNDKIAAAVAAGFDFSTFASAWDPSAMFASSEVGVWYDPSDLSTMFQNSDGTTAVAVDDPIGYIADKSGNDFHGTQSTSGARPLLKTVTESNMLMFDGTDDYLIYAGGVAATVGSIIIPFVTGATAFSTRGLQAIVSSANSAAADVWFEVGITADGRMYLESNAAGTKHTVYGSSFLENSTKYILSLVHDGVDYFATIGSVEQNPLTVESLGTVAWIGDVVSANNLVVGGTVTNAGLVRPFQGHIQAVIITEQDITA